MKFIQLPVLVAGCLVAGSVFADTQKPSVPENVNASPLSDTSLRISWNAAWDNVGISGYNVYRDNDYYATVFSTNYIDSTVSAGSTHQYQIVAFDAANNFSALSNSAQATASTSGSISGAVTPSTDPSGVVSVPTGLQVRVINGNELELQWSQAANASGYNIYRDGSYHSTVNSGTTFRDSVDWGRDYRYTVSGFNGGNNNSGGVPSGYNLVFSDEFRGFSLDGSKWNSQYRWGPDLIINSERQYYVDTLNQPDFGHSPFEFDGEMRARMPRGRGMWPAFWLLHNTDFDRRPEIDVVEMLGHQTDLVYHTYHRFDNGNLVSTPSFQAPGPDYAADFHTYSVLWEPGLIIWYVDGVERNRYQNGNVSHEDMYLLLNLAVGGWWPGDPDGSTPFPARYTIDYIRAYARP